YRRYLPQHAPDAVPQRVAVERLNGLVVSSGQGFEHLLQLAGDSWPDLADLPLFVPSPRVASIAQAADAPVLNTGSTAWMITAAVLVLFMCLPGLALFSTGLVALPFPGGALLMTCLGGALAWITVFSLGGAWSPATAQGRLVL
ncbi:uroporphyrinogen-III synthase, partial [Pseudomonas savastanoi pv. glycinea str. race 4]